MPIIDPDHHIDGEMYLDIMEERKKYATRTARKNLVESYYAETLRVMYRGKFTNRWMEGRPLERSKRATLNLITRAEEEFPGLKLFSIEESIVDFEARSFFHFDRFNNDSTITVAAALWILDQLRKTSKLHQAEKLLTTDRDELDRVYLPLDFYHPNYEQELIQSVALVLDEMLRVFPAESPQNYLDLIGLLETEKVDAAVARFRCGQKDILHRYLLIAEYFDKWNERQLAKIQAARTPNPLIVGEKENWLELADVGGEMEEQHQKIRFLFDMEMKKSRRELIKEYGSREIADALTKDRLYPDPYETAFAALYLLGSGDEMIMNLRSSGLYIFNALIRVPWFKKGAFNETDADEEDDDEWMGIGFNDSGWLEGENRDPVEYHMPGSDGVTVAQRIYRLGKGVVPAGFHPFEAERAEMKEQGVEHADLIADQAEMMFLGAFQARAGNLEGYRWWDINPQAEEEEELEELEEPEEEPPAEDEKALLEKARQEIKNLKTALSTVSREAESDKAKYERELKALRMEHRELADLRELLFNQQADAPERREKVEKQYEYPYTTKRRTVVFGGHDSFLRSIKPMLPDVRFVDASNMTYSPEIIRNADVVWIQNNCISHPQYWSIVKNCKLAGVQMRYFGFASAEKCAEQLVTEDMRPQR